MNLSEKAHSIRANWADILENTIPFPKKPKTKESPKPAKEEPVEINVAKTDPNTGEPVGPPYVPASLIPTGQRVARDKRVARRRIGRVVFKQNKSHGRVDIPPR
jgi:hypothetical protein